MGRCIWRNLCNELSPISISMPVCLFFPLVGVYWDFILLDNPTGFKLFRGKLLPPKIQILNRIHAFPTPIYLWHHACVWTQAFKFIRLPRRALGKHGFPGEKLTTRPKVAETRDQLMLDSNERLTKRQKKGSEYFSGLAIMQLLIQQSYPRKWWSKKKKKLREAYLYQ